jgi:hypothetical protein
MKTKNSIKLPVLVFLLAITADARAQVECITNNIKYVQPPNLAGYDVADSLQYVLADDFVCTQTGPITDIHIWGSWLSNVHGTITNFVLGIYSDVPAITNAAGQVTPSHPGNLLWSGQFPQGQFAESEIGPSQEQYISPGSVTVIGTDSQVWYYCFVPTDPYTQTGSISAPVTYWLAAYAEGNFAPQFNETPQYGWKTTATVQNDTSVNSPWPGVMPPAGAPWTPTTTPQNSPVGAQPLDLAFMLGTPGTIPPCCPETNAVKYEQPPDLVKGIDVDATSIQAEILADDFPCIQTGPVTAIQIWGSWLDDEFDNNATFILSIWSDIPALPTTGQPSHPGQLLWTQVFAPGQYVVCPYTNIPELFFDPVYPAPPSLNLAGSSTNLYLLCFQASPTNVFIQMGTTAQPTNYWLSVSDVSGPGSRPFYFGWKTSTTNYGDTAVSSLTFPYPAPGNWQSLMKPSGSPVNFSFMIDTLTNTPPVTCTETDGVKNIQWPNIGSGFDVWNTPYVLADDFVCTNPGAITDIHLWGSWLNDNPLTGTIQFWLGIYNNVPASATNKFSYPGTNLLWQQWFSPGQYAENVWTANATEQFLNPGTSNVLGPDSVVWYYCFDPTNPFVQSGTIASNQTYWLAAYAQLPVGIPYDYGWKTATNVSNDISVHAPWPGSPPISNPGWTPTAYQPASGGPAVPLDLAFVLTTPTNCAGPIKITRYGTNTVTVVVTWETGILQVSTNVVGPYADVPGAASPYTNITVAPPYKFYRLRCN